MLGGRGAETENWCKIQNLGRATSNPLEKQEGPKSQYQKSQEINGITENGQKRSEISEVSAELYKNEERSQKDN